MIKDISILDAKLKEAFGTPEYSVYNNGRKYKAHYLGLYVNIIPLHPVDYCAWAWTTDTLRQSMVCRNQSREIRHRIFELGVLAFKTLKNTAAVCNSDGATMWYFNEISDDIKLHNFMDAHNIGLETVHCL